MKNLLQMVYECSGIDRIKNEEQLRSLLKSLENEYGGVRRFKITGPRGEMISNFKDFLWAIFACSKNVAVIAPIDDGVYFTLEGTGSVCGYQLIDGAARYSLLTAYELLLKYQYDSGRRESLCVHLYRRQINQESSDLCCAHYGEEVYWCNKHAITDCPAFNYDTVRFGGLQLRPLNEILKELYGFTVELAPEKKYSPQFAKVKKFRFL
ncbi:MAG: hypothetical protein AAB793_02395 [Patescibacteria group bacterium]